MLRVGLTGGLGSGKSTAARIFAELGAHVFYADEIGRGLMEPGQAVYAAIVDTFGPGVLAADGSLDRPALARMAFGDGGGGGRLAELEAIVHPATIGRQEELIDELRVREPDAVAMVESALIFETKHGGEGGWQRRFDRIVLVEAPEELRIARFVQRSTNGRVLTGDERAGLELEARRRLGVQTEGAENRERADYVLTNDGSPERLRGQVERIWPELAELAKS